MDLDPKYFEAKRKLNKLVEQYPGLRASKFTIMIGNAWDAALDRDPSGTQCLHYVNDLIERLTPMAN